MHQRSLSAKAATAADAKTLAASKKKKNDLQFQNANLKKTNG